MEEKDNILKDSSRYYDYQYYKFLLIYIEKGYTVIYNNYLGD